MNYSICFLDKRGLTESSEFVAFDTDAAALAYAGGKTPGHAIVEVWKAGRLVERFYQASGARNGA